LIDFDAHDFETIAPSLMASTNHDHVSNHPRFGGHRVLITGGASGIGRAIATAFASHGALVILVDVNQEQLDEAIKAIGGHARGYVCDVSSWYAQRELFDKVSTTLGPPTIVCLNAGIDPELAVSNPASSTECKSLVRYNYLADEPDGPHTGTPNVLKKPPSTILDVNFYGVMYGIKLASYYMKNHGGRIIVTGSAASYVGFPYQEMYVASKHAILGLVRATAKRPQPGGQTGRVTLSMVAPWLTDTPLTRGHSLVRDEHAVSQTSSASDVARAVLRLAAMDHDSGHGRCLWVRGTTVLEVEESYTKWLEQLGETRVREREVRL
jgi:NAD(P)-dependent dehydrogenase (short-subunit alcohol dehydrogenase family)